MALSNKFGWLVLTTGNKSEMSVGYTTLYGDLAGGFAVIKDVPKTLVYRLCEWRNSARRSSRAARAGGGAPRRRRRASDPGLDHRARALGRAAPRPARRGLAAPLRAARPHPRGLRRARPEPRAADRPGAAGARGRAHDPPGRPRRVQAPPGAAWDQDHAARVRARPAHADHQPLPRLALPRVPLPVAIATPRCASPALVRARAGRLRRHAAGAGRSRTTSSRA